MHWESTILLFFFVEFPAALITMTLLAGDPDHARHDIQARKGRRDGLELPD